MSLRIYLDDSAYAKRLVKSLRAVGHEVVTPFEAGIAGQPDDVHFSYANGHNLILLTKNPDDFEALHREHALHSTILAIYQNNDPTRDMTYADILRALANIESADLPLTGAFHALNAWLY